MSFQTRIETITKQATGLHRNVYVAFVCTFFFGFLIHHFHFEFGEMAGDLSSRVEAIEQVLGIEGLNGKAVSNIAESM